ncbi:capsule assembly Wzi family protein [Fibrella forsythiae]|uniref:Capsule assembly Wzi family protein n=1 Tax=Fibrella forsythiae TaxID=2817061 RepID=A0ABS3JGZ6_9BACT|nr:capsule assembly Wzi family protein [Fibrella forsythiae]MBO0948167.1 hypothetical protein [Fibrella forsythiae]
MRYRYLLPGLLSLLTSETAWGQAPKIVGYRQEILSLLASNGEIPFWMRANQNGIVPRGQTLVSLRSAWQLDYRATPSTAADSLFRRGHKLDWGWGLEAVANGGSTKQLLASQAYLKARVGAIEVWAGRRRETYGLGSDSPLSSGSYIWSGNALPLVKFQLAIPEFWPAKSFLSIKGSFAQGWFADGFVQGSLLHQKSIYIRVGKPFSRVRGYIGFNHQVQWAGHTTHLPNAFIRGQQFPSTWRDYGLVITGASLNEQTDLDTTRYSDFDRGNRVGNHLGTVDLGLEVKMGKLSMLLYRQNIYEDGSLYYLTNIADGLNGIRLRNSQSTTTQGFRLSELTLEYLNTFSQGGEAFINEDNRRRGRDNYFNHGQYRDGWSYMGRSIGTPFIAPQTDLRPELPQYTFFNNNRVRVFHVGVSGQFMDGLTFLVKASYSQNAGSYQESFSPIIDQQSMIVSAGWRLTKNLRLTGSMAMDRGALYTTNTGFSLGLVQAGSL